MKSYMKIALGEAKKAFFKDEVPIGAVIVDTVYYTHLTLPTKLTV